MKGSFLFFSQDRPVTKNKILNIKYQPNFLSSFQFKKEKRPGCQCPLLFSKLKGQQVILAVILCLVFGFQLRKCKLTHETSVPFLVDRELRSCHSMSFILLLFSAMHSVKFLSWIRIRKVLSWIRKRESLILDKKTKKSHLG